MGSITLLRMSKSYESSVVEVPSSAVDEEYEVYADATDTEWEGDRVLVEPRRGEGVGVVANFWRLEHVREGGQMRADALRRERAAAPANSATSRIEVVCRVIVEHTAGSVDQHRVVRN